MAKRLDCDRLRAAQARWDMRSEARTGFSGEDVPLGENSRKRIRRFYRKDFKHLSYDP